MDFKIFNRDRVIILGAGASVDYGLPIWNELSRLVKEKISKDSENRYKFKKEINVWLDKVGKDGYSTIDECIARESRSKLYKLNGHEIENQIFLIIRDIFIDLYRQNEDGWVAKLDEKILSNPHLNLENSIAFINYNYDLVLEDNYLQFKYLTEKERVLVYRTRIGVLSESHSFALYAHGNLFSNEELKHVSHIYRRIRTIKSGIENYIDAVSCFDSERHNIITDHRYGIKLYILGLGAGLKVNLENIDFHNEISEIHVTVKDASRKNEIISFLSERYSLPATEIKIYTTCEELVQKCFNE